MRAIWIADPLKLPEEWDEPSLLTLLGGKGMNLRKLKKAGFRVPEFGILKIELKKEKSEPFMSLELSRSLHRALEEWGCDEAAVRSSAVSEDGLNETYAGVFESFLYVGRSELESKIAKCIDSFQTLNAKEYRKKKGIEDQVDGAVIVQRMISAEVSGVAFSRAPSGNSALCYIEASYGLGEGVVNGNVPVDRYWFDRFGAEVRTEIAKKSFRVGLVTGLERKTGLIQVSAAEADQRTLESGVLQQLVRTVLEIETVLAAPVDVEWALQGGKIYILQARPIVQRFPALSFYSDTNLAESFPGLCSPMTASFVKKVYEAVFISTAKMLGASEIRRKALQPYYSSLIGSFAGHLYYHLNSYYAAISALPGGKRNLTAWHRMVGGANADIESALFPVLTWREKIKFAFRILTFMIFHDRYHLRFKERAELRLVELESALKKTRSSKETAELIVNALAETRYWGVATLNDLLLMGVVEKIADFIKAKGRDESALSGLLKTGSRIDSIAPLRELKRCTVSGDMKWNELLNSFSSKGSALTWDRVLFTLKNEGYSDQAENIRKFLARFGDRSFEELKLESMTFNQSPVQFFSILRHFDLSEMGRSFNEANIDPKALNVTRKLAFLFLLRLAKKAISARESYRLMRGQFFGFMRKALLCFFEKLRSESPELFSKVTDQELFGLECPHLDDYAKGKLDQYKLFKNVKSDWHLKQYAWPEKFCHRSDDRDGFREPPYFIEKWDGNVSAVSASELSGTGASCGVVSGEALVLIHPQEALSRSDLRNKILVTQSTDPAWIYLMVQCAGLISERGSLLSHSAIIGRELGIPTVVGISGASTIIQTGMKIELDGTRGRVKFL